MSRASCKPSLSDEVMVASLPGACDRFSRNDASQYGGMPVQTRASLEHRKRANSCSPPSLPSIVRIAYLGTTNGSSFVDPPHVLAEARPSIRCVSLGGNVLRAILGTLNFTQRGNATS